MPQAKPSLAVREKRSPHAGDTQALSVQGGSNTYLNGALYAPLAPITLGNGSGSNVNSNIVAQSLTMNGGGTLNVTASANLGTANSSVAKPTAGYRR